MFGVEDVFRSWLEKAFMVPEVICSFRAVIEMAFVVRATPVLNIDEERVTLKLVMSISKSAIVPVRVILADVALVATADCIVVPAGD